MNDRAKVIFGNEISEKAYRKAVKSKAKYIRKFGDDSDVDYPVALEKNAYIGDGIGCKASWVYAVLDGLKFLWTDHLHQGHPRTE